MIETLLHTDGDYVCTLVRVTAGIIIFPYGMQKLFGWFGGPGLKASLGQLMARKIPTAVAWLIVIGQSVGSVALIAGVFGRLAAGSLFIIFTGALVVHAPDGWTMNWFGRKNGEGIEYFVMLLTLLLIIIVKGSGAISLDRFLTPPALFAHEERSDGRSSGWQERVRIIRLWKVGRVTTEQRKCCGQRPGIFPVSLSGLTPWFCLF